MHVLYYPARYAIVCISTLKGYTVKLIIVDDTAANLDAAKEAATKFPEHEFVFTSSAHEALGLLPHADGVITDLFFPSEDGAGTNEQYTRYVAMMGEAESLPTFGEVVRDYYEGKRFEAKKRLNFARSFLSDGTIREALEELVATLKGWGNDVSHYVKQLENLPAPQLPYGTAIMLAAKQFGKKSVLVTDMHRHAGGYSTPSNSFDAMVLLLPLMAEGILTIKDVTWDGAIPQYDENHSYTHSLGSKFYIASDRIRKLVGRDSDLSKNSPVVWTEAIQMAIDQSA